MAWTGRDIYGLTNAQQNRIPMNEEYLLGKGFLKEVDEELALEGFVAPNERIIVGSHRPYKTFPYDWFVIVKDQNMNDDIGSLDFAYVDQFETFLKICGVDYGRKMTIDDYIHLIRERLAVLPQIIQTAIEDNEQFNKEYDYCRVSLQPREYSINDNYVYCDVFAKHIPAKHKVVFLDSISLSWAQVDSDAEILKEVRNFINRVCKEEPK
mgnify:CR=1 FL=1